MKKYLKLPIAVSIFCLSTSVGVMADPPDPPPPPSSHGQNGDDPVGAPIDGGLVILVTLGAAYGGIKAWKVRKQCKT